MPVPLRFAQLVASAHAHLTDGRRVEAQACALKAEQLLLNFREALLLSEEIMCLAAIAIIFKNCGNFSQAASRLKRVCELALRHEPNSMHTAGDFYDLAECHLALDQTVEALAAFLRAREIYARAAPDYTPIVDGKIARLLGPDGAPPVALPESASLSVSLECSSINYSLEHADVRAINSLVVRNAGECPLQNVKVRIQIPDYTLATEVTISSLESKQDKEISAACRLNFLSDKLAAQTERVKTRLEVWSNEHFLCAPDVWILAYNECSLLEGHEKVLAAFVHPNNPAVRVVAGQTLHELEDLTGHASFLTVRECASADRLEKIAEAVYLCLQKRYDLVYDYEPPSWETHSQRVRFADEIVVDGRGTCLDLLLLLSSVFENILNGSAMQPLLIVSRGVSSHALFGCWTSRPLTDGAVILDKQSVLHWVEAGELFVMDTTGFVRENPHASHKLDFRHNVSNGKCLITAAGELFAVNLAAARPDYRTGRAGITPLPFRREPPYGESSLRALELSRQAWKEAPTLQVQSLHLLIGLLNVAGGAAQKFFDAIADETSNTSVKPSRLRKYLIEGLRRIQRDDAMLHLPEESASYTAVKTFSKHEAIRMCSLFVDDLHLLFALLRHPGASLLKALSQNSTSPQECLSYLERLYQPPNNITPSEFPSQMS